MGDKGQVCMSMSKKEDKRRCPRVDFKTRLILTAEGTEIVAEGSSRDLSQKGVFIYTDEKLSPGTLCKVRVFLSGGGDPVELSMDAKVARVDSTGMGILFVAMDLDSYTHVKNIVRYNSEDGDEI